MKADRMKKPYSIDARLRFFEGFGIAVISARSAAFTDSGVEKTLETSASIRTTNCCLSIRPANRFGRAFV